MNLLAVVCSAIQDKVNITCEFFFFFGLNCNQTLKAKGVKGLRNAKRVKGWIAKVIRVLQADSRGKVLFQQIHLTFCEI